MLNRPSVKKKVGSPPHVPPPPPIPPALNSRPFPCQFCAMAGNENEHEYSLFGRVELCSKASEAVRVDIHRLASRMLAVQERLSVALDRPSAPSPSQPPPCAPSDYTGLRKRLGIMTKTYGDPHTAAAINQLGGAYRFVQRWARLVEQQSFDCWFLVDSMWELIPEECKLLTKLTKL